MDKNNKKVIITKQPPDWHYIEVYLEGLKLLNICRDEDFYKLYLQMLDYVGEKVKFCGKGDVIEQYLITIQEAVDEREYQDWLKNNELNG